MSKVSVSKCSKYNLDKVYKTIKQGLKDINYKIPKGKKILLKPNVLGGYKPEKAVTTHPIIVEAVIKILKENKCKIVIAESSGFAGSTKRSLKDSGIQALADKYKIKAISFESTEIIKKKIKGKRLNEIVLSKLIDEVDIIVNLPKLKTHSLMTYTAGVKNLFGIIPGGRKPDYHAVAKNPDEFAEILCDIYEAVKPKVKLTIMDAILGMEGNGPAAGKPKQTGLIIVSDDSGALDHTVQKIIGLESPIMKCLINRKLLNPKEIKIIGKVPKIPYSGPSGFLKMSKFPIWLQKYLERQLIAHPYVDEKKCVKCGICGKSCPVKAIKLKPYPLFNRNKCIDCYCCHELCPEQAIYLKGTFMRTLISKLMRIKLISKKKK